MNTTGLPWTSTVVDVVRLRQRRTFAWRAQPGTWLAVCAGRIWMTEAGVDADRFIHAGQAVALQGARRVVIECDSDAPARVAIVSPRLTWIARVAAIFGHGQRWWVSMTEERLRDIGASETMLLSARVAHDIERRRRERILRWQDVPP